MKQLAIALLLGACVTTVPAPEAPRDERPPPPPAPPAAGEDEPPVDDESLVAFVEMLEQSDAPCETSPDGADCAGMARMDPVPIWRSWRRVSANAIEPDDGGPPTPTWEAIAEVSEAPDTRAVVIVELCIDETGGVVHAEVLEASGSPTWRGQIERWVTTRAYRPADEPVCADLTFVHRGP